MEVDTRSLILEMLDFVDDVVDDLGSRKELEFISQMLENGTGAERQLKIYEETNDLKKVVEYIVDQTTEGI
jgi:carboxylate-amine ligase